MKPWILVVCLIFLCNLALGQSWNLHYSDIEVLNPDGSITITPTVSLTGDDGGYCIVFNGFYGYEYPLVMLNGNAWVMGDEFQAGGESGGGQSPVSVSQTFPSVTVQPGESVDLSYAGKVQGVCNVSGGGGWLMPYITAFYDEAFVDGSEPIASPAPCWIEGLLGTPACPTPLPNVFSLTPSGWHPADLDSQQVANQTQNALTYANLNCGFNSNGSPQACSASNPGPNSLHCAYQNGLYACSYSINLFCNGQSAAQTMYVPSTSSDNPGVIDFANSSNLYYSLHWGWIFGAVCSSTGGGPWECTPSYQSGSSGMNTFSPGCTPLPTKGA